MNLFDEFSYERANEVELASTIQEAYLAGNSNDGMEKANPRKDLFGKSYGRGNLSLEDSRQRLAEFKKRTERQACGQNGQWAGDKECPS